MKPIKVMLSEPSYGLVDYRAHDNRLNLYMHLARNERDEEGNLKYRFLTGNQGRYQVHCQREDMADAALINECDYIFFVDDDMVLPRDALFRLLSHNVDICAALAFQRIPPFHPVLYAHENIKGPDGKDTVRWRTVTSYPENELMEIPEVGFGCVLIKVDVFKKVPRPWFASWATIGEDIFFCYKAGQSGIKTHVDTSLKIGHIGSGTIYTEEHFKQFRDKGHLEIFQDPKRRVS